MWLFSFMHSCNIFLQTNSVQTLGPIHKSSFAINTGGWWAFLVQIGDGFLSERTLWRAPLSPARAPAGFPLPPLPLPASPGPTGAHAWLGRGRGGGGAGPCSGTPRRRRAGGKGETGRGRLRAALWPLPGVCNAAVRGYSITKEISSVPEKKNTLDRYL